MIGINISFNIIVSISRECIVSGAIALFKYVYKDCIVTIVCFTSDLHFEFINYIYTIIAYIITYVLRVFEIRIVSN